MRLALIFLAAALPCLPQRLFVYSELTRIDPFGKVIPQDRGAEPRHILSPGIPRNATSSLRVVVQLDKPGSYHLDIAQNPENAVRPMLYKEIFEKHGDTWIADRLQPVTIPYNGHISDFPVPGQQVVTFWLDMTVSRTAPVDRIKVEPQLWPASINDWVVYPMEVRILDAVVPDVKPPSAEIPGVAERSDAALLGPLKQALCGSKEKAAPLALTVRHYIRRNAAQHLALARTKADLVTALSTTPNAPPLERLCSADPPGNKTGPEWYLRLRDNLFRTKSRIIP
jgi:hypothetical protein